MFATSEETVNNFIVSVDINLLQRYFPEKTLKVSKKYA